MDQDQVFEIIDTHLSKFKRNYEGLNDITSRAVVAILNKYVSKVKKELSSQFSRECSDQSSSDKGYPSADDIE